MQFSEATNNTGIVQQTRNLMRVDSTQWPTARIVNSSNNWLDFITGYAIGNDDRFQWDDTNHTKLPEGTASLTSGQAEYSFLVDEQGNSILTLLGIAIYDSTQQKYREIVEADRAQEDTMYFGTVSGSADQITKYDKIADNIIRLDVKPNATVSAGIKFFFQRVGSYFAATDTTKEPGVPELLHRGFVIASAYDGALTLGLENLGALAAERQFETEKLKQYFSGRNNDVRKQATTHRVRFR
jgi:hypothetical protein